MCEVYRETPPLSIFKLKMPTVCGTAIHNVWCDPSLLCVNTNFFLSALIFFPLLADSAAATLSACLIVVFFSEMLLLCSCVAFEC